MLLERSFGLGGILTASMGALLLVLYGWAGFDPSGVGFALSGVVLIGFGAFFWRLGAEARRDRLHLLALAGAAPPEVGSARR